MRMKQFVDSAVLFNLDPDNFRTRVGVYAVNGIIHSTKPGDNTSPRKFRRYDLFVSVVLSRIQDMGVASHDVLRVAADCLYDFSSLGLRTDSQPCANTFLIIERPANASSNVFCRARLAAQHAAVYQTVSLAIPVGDILDILRAHDESA